MKPATLLLIHGLGATKGVWADLIDELDWPAPIVNAQLLGHGSAAGSSDYTVDALAAAVADACDPHEPVIAVGHSLGGAVALRLASGEVPLRVNAAIGLGIKLAWTDADVEGMARVAAKGVRWFDRRDEAVDRFLLQAGLRNVVGNDHPATADAVAQDGDRWRVAQDPLTFAQRPVEAAALIAAATCPVVLGAGEEDEMVSYEDMAAFVAEPRIAAGCGHNLQVQNPGWVAGLIHEVAQG